MSIFLSSGAGLTLAMLAFASASPSASPGDDLKKVAPPGELRIQPKVEPEIADVPDVPDDIGITVGEAYEVNIWADQSIFTPLSVPFYIPRAITFDDANGAYVAARGEIWYLQDKVSGCGQPPTVPCALEVPDGVADPGPVLVLDDTGSPLGQGIITGLLYHGNALFVTRGVNDTSGMFNFSRNEVLKFIDRDGDGIVDDSNNDNILEPSDVIVTTGGSQSHTISTPVAMPGGNRLIVSKGSFNNSTLGPFGSESCNTPVNCTASLLAFNLDGGNLTVFAKGLRNTVEPQFGINDQLFGVDNARNGGGMNPPEEINWIQEGVNYGFPEYIAGSPQPDNATPIGYVLTHEGPTGSAVYSYPELLQFPGDRDQHFQSLYGPLSPSLTNPLGQSIIRLNISELVPGVYTANPESPPDLVTGVTNAFAYGFEHPVDVAMNHRGDMFVVDLVDDGYPAYDDTGRIYRITFKDLEVSSDTVKVDVPFTLTLRGSPFAYYILFAGIDPDTSYAVDLGVNGRNGTSTINNPIQVKSGIMSASGKRTLTIKVTSPAPGLIGHDVRFQLLRVDYDPTTLSFPPGDFYIGKDATVRILP